jgi:hypothetical protein
MSLIINYIIDRFGHTSGKRGTRTPRTHSLINATTIGALVGVPFALIMDAIAMNPTTKWLVGNALVAFFVIPLGALGGASHIILDAFTEKGVYVRSGNRVVIGGFKFNLSTANGIAIVVGIALLLIGIFNSLHNGLVMINQLNYSDVLSTTMTGVVIGASLIIFLLIMRVIERASRIIKI